MAKKFNIIIRVSQVTEDMSEAVPVAEFGLMDSWERLERVLFVEVGDEPEPIRPYQVWIEEIDENGDFPEAERSLVISASTGHWFLADFLKQPKSVWGKLKHEEGLEPVV